MRDSGDESSPLKSLHNKLIAMRAQLESVPKSKYIGYRFHDDENRNIY